MYLVEKHIIKHNNTNFKELNDLTIFFGQTYNQINYQIRQNFFNNLPFKDKYKWFNEIKTNKELFNKDLPVRLYRGLIDQIIKNYKSFFKANNDYKVNPYKYKSRPNIPNYLKDFKQYEVRFTDGAVLIKNLDKHLIGLSGTKCSLQTKLTKQDNIKEVRVLPRLNYIVIELIYIKQEIDLKQNNNKYCSIDLGVNNLATLTYNTGDQPEIINGRPLKSINQYYNKTKAHLTSENKKSKKLNNLFLKRENKINDYLHKASSYITNQLVSKSINTLIIGKNVDWKQDVNMSNINNQNFVSIPFNKFIQKLEYKCKLQGITVKLIEESYTSRCSFLDNESIGYHSVYKGKRMKRGLFKSASGQLINADVNGSYNIMKKVVPNLIREGIEGLAVNPVKVHFDKVFS